MLIGHKIALDPNKQQAAYFAKGCGVARAAWNWALEEWQRQYAAAKADPRVTKPSETALRRLWRGQRWPLPRGGETGLGEAGTYGCLMWA